MDDSEAAAALLLIVEQSYRDLAAVDPSAQEIKKNQEELLTSAERSSVARSKDAILNLHRDEVAYEKTKRKPGSRQKLSKTSQGERAPRHGPVAIFLSRCPCSPFFSFPPLFFFFRLLLPSNRVHSSPLWFVWGWDNAPCTSSVSRLTLLFFFCS